MDHYKSNQPSTFIKHSYTHSLQLMIIHSAIKIYLSNTNSLSYKSIHLKFFSQSEVQWWIINKNKALESLKSKLWKFNSHYHKGVALWYILYSDLCPWSKRWSAKYLLWFLTRSIILLWPLNRQLPLIPLTQALNSLQ